MKKLLIITVLMMTASTSLFADGKDWINLLNNFIGVPDAVDCVAVNQGNVTGLEQAQMLLIAKGLTDKDNINNFIKSTTSTTTKQ